MAKSKKMTQFRGTQRDIEVYEHKDKKRVNNPYATDARFEQKEDNKKQYEFDPHISPTLNWAGKAEGLSFEVPTTSIHIHESIKPHKIISSVIAKEKNRLQTSLLFDSTAPERIKKRTEAIEFYKHGIDWTNRLIAGDSLQIMNSLLEKEGMAGSVQMIYIDPPYGIKYGSNFQPFVNKKDVKDKDEDLSQEPETITAFRDTWELGIHSYLSYLRNRLLLARELLTESGSVFVQISDENVHLVRCLCDEIFGTENFMSMISYATTAGFTTNYLSRNGDRIIWYSRVKSKLKFNKLFLEKSLPINDDNYNKLELPNGDRRNMTDEEKNNPLNIPKNAKVFRLAAITSQGSASETQPFEFNKITYYPGSNQHWKASLSGMEQLKKENRIVQTGNSLAYVRYFYDFPCQQFTDIWTDTGTGGDYKKYVVQTNEKTIQRCLLMTTDPGDLVLDITCGSGTTAFVAEQWGRRWITCDTSRVAITLAKQRLMTAVYDYYKLQDEHLGVASGFIYKTVPHVTLKSIANGEPAAAETLYDQPEIDKNKVRITGPYTVEALPAPVVKALDDLPDYNFSTKQADYKDELLATGILGRKGEKIVFSRVEALAGTKYIQAEAETIDGQKALVCFGSETKALDARIVELVFLEAEKLRPLPQMIIFAAFQFDPEAVKLIDETMFKNITLLKVQMNTDLMTDDLKKKRASSQSFWLIGQPDVKLEKAIDNKYKVKINGYDYYNVKTGVVDSGNATNIAMWMLDTNYDRLCFEPCQVFFPLGGKNDGWGKLAKTLKAEINQDLIEQYAGVESLTFEAMEGTEIAVKIIDDRGIESIKIIKVEAYGKN